MMREASPQLTMVLDALRSHGCSPRAQANGEWLARCPTHDDDTPSLSVGDGDVAVVLHCHFGCPFEAIVAALGLRAEDLFYADKRGRGRHRGQVVATYAYGERLVKIRYAPKRFAWYCDGKPGSGGRKPNDLLFGEEILPADPSIRIVICEGEKAAIAARQRLGLVAVAGAGAAGWRPTPRVVELFRGREDVLLWADADSPGWRWGRGLVASLAGVARSVRVIIVPDVPSGFDAADFDGDACRLEQYVRGTEAIPDASDETGEPRRFVCVIRGSADLDFLSDLEARLYWALVAHEDGGILRVVATTPKDLAQVVGRRAPRPQVLAHVSRALRRLVAQGLIVVEGPWYYVRRGARFAKLAGKQIAAAQKMIPRLPGSIRAAILADEPSLGPSPSSRLRVISPLNSPDSPSTATVVDTTGAFGQSTGREEMKPSDKPGNGGPRPYGVLGDVTERTAARTAERKAGRIGKPHLRAVPDALVDCPDCGRDSCEGDCAKWRGAS